MGSKVVVLSFGRSDPGADAKVYVPGNRLKRDEDDSITPTVVAQNLVSDLDSDTHAHLSPVESCDTYPV